MTKITIMDGGMGQELIHRSSQPPSPLWSAKVMMDEPDIVETLHREFIEAGAQIITLNNYSATPERLARDAIEDLFEPLQAKAIEIAKSAVGDTPTKIAGCLPPLYGSYHPEVAPSYENCLKAYARIAQCQKDGIDLFICETMSSVKEAETATLSAKATGKPVWCALTLEDEGGCKLRSGEAVELGIEAAKKAGADAILFNCSLPEVITEAMPILAKCGLPFGAYANCFTKANTLQIGGTVEGLTARTDLGPSEYADFCQQWVDMGATIIGGCCEVGPAHIAELNSRFA